MSANDQPFHALYIDPAQSRTLLQRSLSATRTGLTETRRALQALRSSPLEDLGLALAILMLVPEIALFLPSTMLAG